MREMRKRLLARLRNLVDDERAATAIEYALMASGIAMAIVVTVTTLGSTIKTNLYDKVSAMF